MLMTAYDSDPHSGVGARACARSRPHEQSADSTSGISRLNLGTRLAFSSGVTPDTLKESPMNANQNALSIQRATVRSNVKAGRPPICVTSSC